AADPGARALLGDALDAPFAWQPAEDDIARVVASADAAALAKSLRVLRRRLLIHTIARDLTGRAQLLEVCNAVTRLAELSLRAAVTLHHDVLARVHGEPIGEDGTRQHLIVIGMGKLGGGELNVSS